MFVAEQIAHFISSFLNARKNPTLTLTFLAAAIVSGLNLGNAQTPVYQINSGGGAVAPFAADQFNTGGQVATPVTNSINTSGVTNPAPQGVYQTEYYCCTNIDVRTDVGQGTGCVRSTGVGNVSQDREACRTLMPGHED